MGFSINSLESHTQLSPEKWIPGDGWISGWISGYVSYAMRDGRPLLKVLGVVGTVEVDDGVPHGSKTSTPKFTRSNKRVHGPFFKAKTNHTPTPFHKKKNRQKQN